MSIFAACTVFLDFSFDFGSILNEKSMFFRTRFPHGVCVFFEMATLTIVWFLQYETYFFIFRLRTFFSKKMQKNDPKPQYEKSLEKRPSGDLFWSPKSIKIDVGAARNRKNLPKMTKIKVPIFMGIFACETNAKNRKKTPAVPVAARDFFWFPRPAGPHQLILCTKNNWSSTP